MLSAHFDIDDYSEDGRFATIGNSVFTVILTDDRGKIWRIDLEEERILVDD
jgi:hypothetical protein